MNLPATDNKKPVFVLITADPCGACQRFKATQWDKLNKTLKTGGRVQIVHINLPDMNPVFSTKEYPIGLRNIVAWYPTMALIPNNVWMNGRDKDMNVLENCVVMNGQIIDGKIAYGGNIPFLEKDVAKWVNDMLAGNPLFNPANKQVVTVTKEVPRVEIINIEIPRITNSTDVRRAQVAKSDGKTSIVITNGGRPLDSVSNGNNGGNLVNPSNQPVNQETPIFSSSSNKKFRIVPTYGSYTGFSAASVK